MELFTEILGIGKRMREPIFPLVSSLILGVILISKHFNFLTHPNFLIFILYVGVKFRKFTIIFLAHFDGTYLC